MSKIIIDTTNCEVEERSSMLKPCPLCGGKANVYYLPNEQPFVYMVQCTECHLMTQQRSYSEIYSLIDLWNTRVEDNSQEDINKDKEEIGDE